MVALVLVGVGGGELGDGFVEDVRAAEVRGDSDPVPGAGVCPRERPPAHFSVYAHAADYQSLDGDGVFPVTQLADVEVALLPVRADLGPLPAQEDVAARLHQPLPRDHPLAHGWCTYWLRQTG